MGVIIAHDIADLSAVFIRDLVQRPLEKVLQTPLGYMAKDSIFINQA